MKNNIENLVDIRDVVINSNQSREERIKSFMEQIRDPLCYRCGEYIVQISFAENTDRTFESCFAEYLKSL